MNAPLRDPASTSHSRHIARFSSLRLCLLCWSEASALASSLASSLLTNLDIKKIYDIQEDVKTGKNGEIVEKNVSRLCHAKAIVTVNARYQRPTIYAREGDRIIVNVSNHVQYNITIHWHGLKQFRNGWADGPTYIMQCPIQSGNSYSYDFAVMEQRGTLWWHTHILWLRATVYGAIVIMPKKGVRFPFPLTQEEVELILGRWLQVLDRCSPDSGAGLFVLAS